MRIADDSDQHLTYCLNVHPGETWDELFTAVREKALAVRDRVAPGLPFGLGLRLGHGAAAELHDRGRREEFSAFLQEENLYVFTINGFPYGQFHGGKVKEKVYQPDWRTTTRRDYTLSLADLLVELLPEGMSGSISTVPGSFKPWVLRTTDPDRMVERLVECVSHLATLHERCGKEIHLGLEPEPGCYLESTQEFLDFFQDRILRTGSRYLVKRKSCTPDEAEAMIRRHLGVCFDTCHLAIQYEDLARSLARFKKAGVRISKVQLSAALEAHNELSQLEALHPFVEPVYLHQVKARTRHGAMRSWTDLPDALRDIKQLREFESLRVHFHVPLFWEGTHLLSSTSAQLKTPFFEGLRECGCEHLEIETYTFDVLPPLRAADVVDSISAEFEWALPRLRHRRPEQTGLPL